MPRTGDPIGDIRRSWEKENIATPPPTYMVNGIPYTVRGIPYSLEDIWPLAGVRSKCATIYDVNPNDESWDFILKPDPGGSPREIRKPENLADISAYLRTLDLEDPNNFICQEPTVEGKTVTLWSSGPVKPVSFAEKNNVYQDHENFTLESIVVNCPSQEEDVRPDSYRFVHFRGEYRVCSNPEKLDTCTFKEVAIYTLPMEDAMRRDISLRTQLDYGRVVFYERVNGVNGEESFSVHTVRVPNPDPVTKKAYEVMDSNFDNLGNLLATLKQTPVID